MRPGAVRRILRRLIGRRRVVFLVMSGWGLVRNERGRDSVLFEVTIRPVGGSGQPAIVIVSADPAGGLTPARAERTGSPPGFRQRLHPACGLLPLRLRRLLRRRHEIRRDRCRDRAELFGPVTPEERLLHRRVVDELDLEETLRLSLQMRLALELEKEVRNRGRRGGGCRGSFPCPSSSADTRAPPSNRPSPVPGRKTCRGRSRDCGPSPRSPPGCPRPWLRPWR